MILKKMGYRIIKEFVNIMGFVFYLNGDFVFIGFVKVENFWCFLFYFESVCLILLIEIICGCFFGCYYC